jgi:nucleotidyltransferase substrate binding protein (TIGR01987 family)
MAVSVQEYEKALHSLDEALTMYASFIDEGSKKLARDACIQRFEFCVELGWKVSAKVMGTNSTAANTVIREMARDGLIDNPEDWFSFVVARNESSHTYDEKVALKVFAVISQFLPNGLVLLSKLKAR